MARGDSGRIVIEVGTETKRQPYAALDSAGSTLKEWFVKRAADFCPERTQPAGSNRRISPAQWRIRVKLPRRGLPPLNHFNHHRFDRTLGLNQLGHYLTHESGRIHQCPNGNQPGGPEK